MHGLRIAHAVRGGSPLRFGTGFILYTTALSDGGSVAKFGHGGIGGSVGFADRERKLAFGYVMNEMNSGFRPVLEDTIYECIVFRSAILRCTCR